MSPAPRVVLIAGGSRGIGAATARLASRNGFDVAVNYRGNRSAAEEVVEAVKAAGRRAAAIQGDMAREDDVARVFATADSALGSLTDLVYSCGITGKPSALEVAETATLREVLELNVLGALLCARAAIPRLSTKHGGRGGTMVFLSSAAATIGSAGEYVWYAASKGAIDSMTLGLGRELAADGIRVNAVAPGLIDTDMQPSGRIERLAPTVALRRAGQAEEVAQAIVFLLSDAASYITASVLRVAGGR